MRQPKAVHNNHSISLPVPSALHERCEEHMGLGAEQHVLIQSRFNGNVKSETLAEALEVSGETQSEPCSTR